MKIVLYQIIPELDEKHFMFNGLNYIKKQCGDKFPAGLYETVYQGDVEAETCEDIWILFNTKIRCKGHSMSVSDVVEIIQSDKKSRFYFCDSIGFKEIDFDKAKTMSFILNHNFDCVNEKREYVSVFFISKNGLEDIKCKLFELKRCKFSENQLGYRILCEQMDGKKLKFDFSDPPAVILSKCKEPFPRELLYTDDKHTRYTVHDKANLGIVCTWLMRKEYVFESFYGGYKV